MITNYNNSLAKLKEFFEEKNSLTELNIPELIFIDTNAAASLLNGLIIDNDNLTTISFPNLEQQPYYFVNRNLKELNLNSLKRVEFGVYNLNNSELRTRFLQNTKIRKLNLPNFIGTASSNNALPSGITDIENDLAKTASFWDNYWLEDVSLGNQNMLPTNVCFNGFWFRNNYFLQSLRLNYPFVITLVKGIAGFSRNPIGSGNGRIYVPDDLLEDYLAAEGWNELGQRGKIYPLSQYIEITDTITDSWETILNNCNSGQIGKYNIGDTKTIYINNTPTQMVIVDKEHDMLADNSGFAKLTWLEKTISRFNTYSTLESYTTDTPRRFSNATNTRAILEELYNGLDSIFTASTGIKTVKKTNLGRNAAGNPEVSTSNEKLWLPSAEEINISQNATGAGEYTFFSNSEPNYTIGATNLTTINGERVSFALRDISNNSSDYLDIVRATASGSPAMELVTNNSQQPYFILGFCT